ncbi:hypothetical protein PENSPDRAFT_707641 [Peniophora sp. CONT]|nr:hypothetical protein PENSPDRAFT_707641 [Peniophora sp. CONT]
MISKEDGTSSWPGDLDDESDNRGLIVDAQIVGYVASCAIQMAPWWQRILSSLIAEVDEKQLREQKRHAVGRHPRLYVEERRGAKSVRRASAVWPTSTSLSDRQLKRRVKKGRVINCVGDEAKVNMGPVVDPIGLRQSTREIVDVKREVKSTKLAPNAGPPERVRKCQTQLEGFGKLRYKNDGGRDDRSFYQPDRGSGALTRSCLRRVPPRTRRRRRAEAAHIGEDVWLEGQFGQGRGADMLENGYLLPRALSDAHQPEDAEDWVESTTVSEGEDAEVYALDCEMCITSRGKELARVSVLRIDSNNGEAKVVLDTHVLPGAPITDYLTRFSGITPASLEGCTTTLSDVQTKLLKLLKPSPGQRSSILLGHSLESDLCALKLRHGRCIDTALIYYHPRGRPLKPGLAWLTRKWCGREIQARGEGGHDPEEDARACAELLRRKIENGPGFGTFKTDTEPIFERIARAKNGAVRTAAVDRNPAEGFASRASTATPAANDAAVCAGVVDAVRTGHGFVFGRFTELADALGWVTPKPTDPAVSQEPLPPPPTLKEALDNLTARLADIHAALPLRTALIVMSGHSDPREMSRLSARRLAFEAYQRAAASKSTHHPSHLPQKPANPFVVSSGATAAVVANTGVEVDGTDESEVDEEVEEKPSWTAADARALEEAVAHARRGLLFLGFKN